MSNPLEMSFSLHMPRGSQRERKVQSRVKSSFKDKDINAHFFTLFDLRLSAFEFFIWWKCCIPPSFSPNLYSYFPPTPSTDAAGTLFCTLPFNFKPNQTSVLKSQRHKEMYFYSTLEPLPPEYLTRFHTFMSSTKSNCNTISLFTTDLPKYLS